MMSFDSVPLAMVTLLSATTWDTWETSMFCLMDITGNWWCLLYYLGIIILGGCFARNLFLAVLFEEFTQLGRVNVATEKMEKRAAELKGEIEVKEEKVVPTGFLADLANSSLLSGASILLVLVNMVLMCMPYYGMSDEYAANLEAAAGLRELQSLSNDEYGGISFYTELQQAVASLKNQLSAT
jgi:hypothetical protein